MDWWTINSWSNLEPAQSTFVCPTVWVRGRAWGFDGAWCRYWQARRQTESAPPRANLRFGLCRVLGWLEYGAGGEETPLPRAIRVLAGDTAVLSWPVKQSVWIGMGICKGSSESLSTPVQIITIMYTNLSEAVGMHPHENKRTQNRHARSCLRWNWRIFFFWVLNAHS